MGNRETEGLAGQVLCDKEFIPEHRIPLWGQKGITDWQLSLYHLCLWGQHPTRPIPMACPMLCGMGSASKYLPMHPAQEAQGRGKPAQHQQALFCVHRKWGGHVCRKGEHKMARNT